MDENVRLGRGLAMVAIVMSCFFGSAQAADRIEVTKWFRMDQSLTRTWTATASSDGKTVELVKKGITDPQRKVMAIYRKKSPAYDTAVSRILAVFQEKSLNIVLTAVFVGNDTEYTKQVLASAKDEGYELIYAVGSSAVRKVFQHYKGGAVPVVTVCAKDPVLLDLVADYDGGSGNNFAFTSLNAPAESVFNYLLTLKPDLKNVSILYAEQNESAVQTQYLPMADLAEKFNVRVHGVAVKERKNAALELTELIPDAITDMKTTDPDLKNSIFWITGSTSVFQKIAVINAHAGNVPVLAVNTNIVTEGDDTAVMSIGVSFDSNAHLAAIYGLDILAGADPGQKPVGIVSPPDVAISFRKAREIGMKIPFDFFEIAGYVYDARGKIVRAAGKTVVAEN